MQKGKNDFSNNLKDSSNDEKDSPVLATGNNLMTVSSTLNNKANKLVTALYMVTDIIDKDEPIRLKLRNAGAGIISDIYSLSQNPLKKISETIAFLDIASTMNLISEMNYNILKKEFINLSAHFNKRSFQTPNWLEEFLEREEEEEDNFLPTNPIRHMENNTLRSPASIGVQKGSTLLKALSDKNFIKTLNSHKGATHPSSQTPSRSQDQGKQNRRADIIRIMKSNDSGLTITDIKVQAKNLSNPSDALIKCSEKTLQRELVSMVKDNILNRTGSKRWSRYFLKK